MDSVLLTLWAFLGALVLYAVYAWGHHNGVKETQHYIDAMVRALEQIQCTDGTTIGERADAKETKDA